MCSILAISTRAPWLVSRLAWISSSISLFSFSLLCWVVGISGEQEFFCHRKRSNMKRGGCSAQTGQLSEGQYQTGWSHSWERKAVLNPQESDAKLSMGSTWLLAVPPHGTVGSIESILPFGCLLPANLYLTGLFHTMQTQICLFGDNKIW